MTNIPTDLLRTLVSVVDLRSFTRAAQSLGVTQPAVSAQIKRLQYLLGSELLDKSAPGVSLTPTGEQVVNYARRLLSINDQILSLATPRPHGQTVRIGVPGDCIVPSLSNAFAGLMKQWPDIRFDLRSNLRGALIQELRKGEIDVIVVLTTSDPTLEAYDWWTEELVWMRSDATRVDPDKPVPLLASSEESVCYRAAVTALNQIGRSHELVLTASSTRGLAAAMMSGIGVSVHTRGREVNGIYPWDDGPLPKLPDVYRAVYLREGGDREMLEQLADAIANALRPAPTLAHQIAAAG